MLVTSGQALLGCLALIVVLAIVYDRFRGTSEREIEDYAGARRDEQFEQHGPPPPPSW